MKGILPKAVAVAVMQSEKQPCVLRSARNESVYRIKCSVNLLTIINVLKNKWVVLVFHPRLAPTTLLI